MNNKDLFKEAIADAKAVREAALANAKAALEETLTPRLQSMLAAKLQEMEGEDEIEEGKKEEMEEGFKEETTGDFIQDRNRAAKAALQEEEELDEDFDLAEILAELDDESEIDEAKKKDDDKKEDKKEKKEKDHEDKESKEEEEEHEPGGEEAGEEESEEEIEVKDMSVEDLQNMIRDIVAQEMGGGVDMGAEEVPAGDAMGGLDMGAEAPVGDETNAISIPAMGEEEKDDELDEIDLEELLAELDALDEVKAEDELDEAKKEKELDEAKKKNKEELDEAIKTIQILRKELNESNLLNAKLLYVNKLFKAKNLTESQKVKVIASFDKAKTVKEAKAVFETLQENLNTAPAKKQIKENLGFASKAAGVAPKQQIVESDDAIARMKKLAGLK